MMLCARAPDSSLTPVTSTPLSMFRISMQRNALCVWVRTIE
jgi:hypothetical protein